MRFHQEPLLAAQIQASQKNIGTEVANNPPQRGAVPRTPPALKTARVPGAAIQLTTS